MGLPLPFELTSLVLNGRSEKALIPGLTFQNLYSKVSLLSKKGKLLLGTSSPLGGHSNGGWA